MFAADREAHVEATDVRAHQVLAQGHLVRVGVLLRPSLQHLPDPTEQPKRRVVPVLGEREDEVAVEVVLDAPPRVPAVPLLVGRCQNVDRVLNLIPDREVDLERRGVKPGGHQRGERDGFHGLTIGRCMPWDKRVRANLPPGIGVKL